MRHKYDKAALYVRHIIDSILTRWCLIIFLCSLSLQVGGFTLPYSRHTAGPPCFVPELGGGSGDPHIGDLRTTVCKKIQ